MEPKRLSEQIQDYYESQRLSPEALDRLRSSIREKQPRRASSGRRIGIAAGLAGILLASLFLIHFARSFVIARAIAREAAQGHNQRLAVELSASDFRDLRASMDNLGFAPVEPARFQG